METVSRNGLYASMILASLDTVIFMYVLYRECHRMYPDIAIFQKMESAQDGF